VSRPEGLRTRYGEQIALLRRRVDRLWLALLVVAIAATPAVLDDAWLSVLTFTAIAAIGAIGLNLLTGFTGQVSLGHAFFIGLGAYTAGYLGGDLGLPVLVWLPVAGLVGALVGLAIGPFAVRLKGIYLGIVTLGLVFLGEYAFQNLRVITGGPQGRAIPSPRIGDVNLADLGATLGLDLSREQSFFYFIAPLLLAATLFAKNVARGRAGRAFQAIRDREIAASVIGVDVARYKVAAFGLSSFYAAASGALLGSYVRHVTPASFDLFVSVQFVAMVIVGGVGTVYGSIFGALFIVLLPRLVEQLSPVLPLASESSAGGGLTLAVLNQVIYGLLIVGFLVAEPLGLAGIWARLRLYFRTWPFSY